MSNKIIDFDGLKVSVYRDKYGDITLDVNSDKLEDEDVFQGTQVPKLVILVAGAKIVLDKDGPLGDMTAKRSAVETAFAWRED